LTKILESPLDPASGTLPGPADGVDTNLPPPHAPTIATDDASPATEATNFDPLLPANRCAPHHFIGYLPDAQTRASVYPT
jgi:hypothetical protein